MSAAFEFSRKTLPFLWMLALVGACGTTTGSGGDGLADVAVQKDVIMPSFGKDIVAPAKDVAAQPKDAQGNPPDVPVVQDIVQPQDLAVQTPDVPAEPDVAQELDVPQQPDIVVAPDVPAAKDVAPSCGDGTCTGGVETCTSCPADCGACPSVCNPLTSASCKANEQCYVNSKGVLACAAPGTLTKGAGCKYLADCAKGMLCVDSACRPVCDAKGSPPVVACSAAGATCVELVSASGPIGYNLGACIGGDGCNLLTNGCPTGLMCVPFATDKACVTAGTIAVGGDCTAPSALCKADGVCIDDATGTTKHCLQKCGADGGAPKCTTKTCGSLSIGDPPKSAPDNLGACF